MSKLLTAWFADPTFQLVYLLVTVAVFTLPMIWLARWYHANIGKTRGGRALQQWQRDNPPDQAGGLDAARAIERGDYGDGARSMQHRIYWFVAGWLLVVAVFVAAGICFMPSGEAG